MELSTKAFCGSMCTNDFQNNTSNNLNASLLYSNESYKNGRNVSAASPSFSEVRHLLVSIVSPFLIVLGTYGNAVSFSIMRRGSFKNVSTCFYMAMLAIADTVVLWCGCFTGWVIYTSGYRVNPNTWLDCKLMYFLFLFSIHASSGLLTVMCIEKFFALYFPIKTRSICTVAMAKKVTFVVTLILAGINLQHCFIWEAAVAANGLNICKLVNVPDNYIEIYIKIDYTLYSYGPFAIMVLANGAIIYKFMRASCAVDQGGTESTNQALSKSANKGTAMLITVSIMFLVLTAPIAVIDNSVEIKVHPVIWTVAVLLRFTNNSINAVLYCVSGTRFRNELMKTFPFRLCRKNTNLCSGSQSVSSLTGKYTSATFTSDVSITASAQ